MVLRLWIRKYVYVRKDQNNLPTMIGILMLQDVHSLNKLKGHFTHEPRVVTMKLQEPKRKCAKAVPRHLQNHVV